MNNFIELIWYYIFNHGATVARIEYMCSVNKGVLFKLFRVLDVLPTATLKGLSK